ncbi:MAG: glycosyl transferase family 39 [Cyanobacteria bacterium CRU_2_1]|nr:glycosyl transferase family 39 [Cyanobacteria bacterium RU_5_0]NJR61544.1 glycosyl transferase family 39 [Cyanobacteria bacterium CRU_2_1]
MRAAGFTRQEIDTELFQNKFFPAPELQKFQQIKPGSTVADTIYSLRTEDPQHPPLYFLMARQWMQWFGGSLTASRSLPAFLSLLSLPLMYGLAMELFAFRLAALLSTALLALSPFDILFAQTARQYGLLTTIVIGSSWLLVRAVRRSTWQHWGLYALSVAIGLYTHPFFALTVVGQGAYVLLMSLAQKQDSDPEGIAEPQLRRTLSATFLPWAWRLRSPVYFVSAIAIALILYIPWILVLLDNHQRASATTDWTRASVGILYLLKLWTLSFTSLFIDLDFGFENPVTYLLRSPFVLLIFAAGYVVYRRTPKAAGLFVLTSVLVPFLLLAIPDVVIGGKRSAVSRYLISCYPGIQLAVAYFLSVGLSTGKQLYRWILAIVFTSSLISITASAQAESWWSKDLSYFNARVVHLVNAEAENTSPVLASNTGNDFTNMGDLLSLSYKLKENVRIYGISQSPDLEPLHTEPNVLLFRATKELEDVIIQQGWKIESVSDPGRLRRLIQ